MTFIIAHNDWTVVQNIWMQTAYVYILHLQPSFQIQPTPPDCDCKKHFKQFCPTWWKYSWKLKKLCVLKSNSWMKQKDCTLNRSTGSALNHNFNMWSHCPHTVPNVCDLHVSAVSQQKQHLNKKIQEGSNNRAWLLIWLFCCSQYGAVHMGKKYLTFKWNAAGWFMVAACQHCAYQNDLKAKSVSTNAKLKQISFIVYYFIRRLNC